MAEDSTKNQLLDSAEYLFAHHGVDATSLRMVADRAGVNSALIAYHFGSKNGLVAALTEIRGQGLIDEINQVINEESTHLSRLVAFIFTLAHQLLSARMAFGAFFLRESTLLAETPTTRALVPLHIALRQRLTTLLDEGRRAGAFRYADPDGLHDLMIGAVAAKVRPSLKERTNALEDPPSQVTHLMLEVFEHLLGVKSDHQPAPTPAVSPDPMPQPEVTAAPPFSESHAGSPSDFGIGFVD